MPQRLRGLRLASWEAKSLTLLLTEQGFVRSVDGKELE